MVFEGLQRGHGWVPKRMLDLPVDLSYSDSNASFLVRYLTGVQPSIGCAPDEHRTFECCAL